MRDIPSLTKRILFCTDFSPNASLAFDYAIDAAIRRPGCMLYLLHVIPAPDAQYWKTYLREDGIDVNQKAKDDIDAKINAEYRPRVPADVNFTTVFRIGKAYVEIIDFAKTIDANLIVLEDKAAAPSNRSSSAPSPKRWSNAPPAPSLSSRCLNPNPWSPLT